MAHLNLEAILDGLEGRMNGADLNRLRSHLADCKACAEEFGRYGELLDAMSHPPLAQAPAGAIQRAFDLFEPAHRSQPTLGERISSLVFDSWSQAAIAGFRSAGMHIRQIAMTEGEFDLHLSLDYTSSFIRGQLLRRSRTDFECEFDVLSLDGNGGEVDSTVANVLGEFVVYCSPQRVDLLMIRLPEGTMMRFQLPQHRVIQ